MRCSPNRSGSTDGRAVRVPGFLGIGSGCVALFIGEADYRHRMMANSIWVNLPS